MISLVSVNIEGSRHIDTVRDFLSDKKPSVICLQEIPERVFSLYKKEFRMEGVFCPMTLVVQDDSGLTEPQGLAILARTKIRHSYASFYRGRPDIVAPFDNSSVETISRTVSRMIVGVEVVAHGEPYRVLTTHFTWTPDGNMDRIQKQDLDAMLEILDQKRPFVLCGDFNAPRGREAFAKLSSLYKDNIPRDYDSSIDPILHRAKDLRVMIDGIFSTPEYEISDVRLLPGISDHCAVTATVRKKTVSP